MACQMLDDPVVSIPSGPDRPRWWGPDWRQVPLACWLSIPLTAVPAGLVAWILLDRYAPSLFGPSARHNTRGLSLGEWLSAVVAGLSCWPVLYAWMRALRRRGLTDWRR